MSRVNSKQAGDITKGRAVTFAGTGTLLTLSLLSLFDGCEDQPAPLTLAGAQEGELEVAAEPELEGLRLPAQPRQTELQEIREGDDQSQRILSPARDISLKLTWPDGSPCTGSRVNLVVFRHGQVLQVDRAMTAHFADSMPAELEAGSYYPLASQSCVTNSDSVKVKLPEHQDLYRWALVIAQFEKHVPFLVTDRDIDLMQAATKAGAPLRIVAPDPTISVRLYASNRLHEGLLVSEKALGQETIVHWFIPNSDQSDRVPYNRDEQCFDLRLPSDWQSYHWKMHGAFIDQNAADIGGGAVRGSISRYYGAEYLDWDK